MADSLSPQAPPAPGRLYGSDQRRLWRATEQLQRRRVTTPQAAPVVSGGGIVGQGETLSQPGGVNARAGVASMDNFAITWDPPYDPNTGAPVDWMTTTATGIVVPDGWYSIVALFGLHWSAEADSPSAFAPVAGGSGALPALDGHVRPRSKISATTWGLYDYIHTGPVYVTGEIQPSCTYLTETPGADAAQARVGYTITRYA